MTVWLVFVAALGTALATGMGAVPLLLRRTRTHGWLAIGDAIAAGMMTAATIALLYEGARDGVLRVGVGVVLGIAAMAVAARLATRHRTPKFGSLRGADALAAISIVGAMTAHSFTEGAGVGVSFGGGRPSVSRLLSRSRSTTSQRAWP